MSVVTTITTAILPIPQLSTCTSAWRFEMMMILQYHTYVQTFLAGSCLVVVVLFPVGVAVGKNTRQDMILHGIHACMWGLRWERGQEHR